jgi:hypothetical protein
MATRRSKGFIQLEWVCPNCNSRNPGPKKTCENCGAPQPDNVQFYAPAQAKLIQDENVARAAAAGADIHCGFCGTRNPATATVCSQCGGDLKEGRQRTAGKEMKRQAAPTEVTCTNCGQANPSTRTMCANCGAALPLAASAAPPPAPGGMSFSTPGALTPAAPVIPAKKPSRAPWLILGGVLACIAVICVVVGALFIFPTATVEGTVTNLSWQTSVPIQEVQPVNYSNRPGSPPSDAYNVSCRTESQEVCEEKVVDTGTGYGEVVQECHTESQDYCSYTVDEWTTVRTETLNGNDNFPVYADPFLAGNQRKGPSSEDLNVYFSTSKGQLTYSPGTVSEFQQFSIGSMWTLRLNALGGIVSVER